MPARSRGPGGSEWSQAPPTAAALLGHDGTALTQAQAERKGTRRRSPTSPEQCQGHRTVCALRRDRGNETLANGPKAKDKTRWPAHQARASLWLSRLSPDGPAQGLQCPRAPRPPFCSRALGSGTRCSAPPGSRSSAGGRPAACGEGHGHEHGDGLAPGAALTALGSSFQAEASTC